MLPLSKPARVQSGVKPSASMHACQETEEDGCKRTTEEKWELSVVSMTAQDDAAPLRPGVAGGKKPSAKEQEGIYNMYNNIRGNRSKACTEWAMPERAAINALLAVLSLLHVASNCVSQSRCWLPCGVRACSP